MAQLLANQHTPIASTQLPLLPPIVTPIQEQTPELTSGTPKTTLG